ncbi:MAG: hypothetical protein NVS2B17_29210 [Candidatus Velthaea sp.]
MAFDLSTALPMLEAILTDLAAFNAGQVVQSPIEIVTIGAEKISVQVSIKKVS